MNVRNVIDMTALMNFHGIYKLKQDKFFFPTGAHALEASVAAVSKYGGASAGYRTMLDALIPASTVLKQVTCIHSLSRCSVLSIVIYLADEVTHAKQRLKAGDDPVTAFIASSEAASVGAESTKQMQAKVFAALHIP
jgi:triose/dihydroxyacetone kinase / FAD-AMP lyase (cyclizing)